MTLNGEKIKEEMSKLCSGYSFSDFKVVGRSWLSRDISCVTVGHGRRKVMIVGGFCGVDGGVSSFLTEFTHELDDCLSFKRRISEFNIEALCNGNTIHIIPFLNPDGILLNSSGISPDNPFHDRVLKMMKGTTDFTKWNSNIRGTQLNHNFNYKWIESKFKERNLGIFSNGPLGYGGEYPESELETSSLCSYCRSLNPEIVIEFRVGSKTEIIPCLSESAADKCKRAVKLISGYTGISSSENESAFHGSFAGWTAKEFSASSVIFNVENELSDRSMESLKSSILLFCAQ